MICGSSKEDPKFLFGGLGKNCGKSDIEFDIHIASFTYFLIDKAFSNHLMQHMRTKLMSIYLIISSIATLRCLPSRVFSSTGLHYRASAKVRSCE